MTMLRVDGRCHCGAIRYEAQVDPAYTVICHCPDCQTMSGAPYRVNVPASTKTLRMDGEPSRYVKIGGSGEAVTTAFCGICGTPIYSAKGEAPAFVFLRIGAIAQRAALAPRMQGFCDSALFWSVDIRDVPTAPANPVA